MQLCCNKHSENREGEGQAHATNDTITNKKTQLYSFQGGLCLKNM